MQNDLNIAHTTCPEEMVGAEACPQMLTYREETGNEEYTSCQDQEAQKTMAFINDI